MNAILPRRIEDRSDRWLSGRCLMVLRETLVDELASEDTEPPRGRKDEREVEALALEITEFRPEWEEELPKAGEGSMEPEINCEVDQKVISSPKSRGGI